MKHPSGLTPSPSGFVVPVCSWPGVRPLSWQRRPNKSKRSSWWWCSCCSPIRLSLALIMLSGTEPKGTLLHPLAHKSNHFDVVELGCQVWEVLGPSSYFDFVPLWLIKHWAAIDSFFEWEDILKTLCQVISATNEIAWKKSKISGSHGSAFHFDWILILIINSHWIISQIPMN